MICLDDKTSVSDARSQALASLGRNRIALARAQIPAALHARSVMPQTQPQAKVKRIGYGRLEKEASERIRDMALKSLKLTKPWKEYGSTDGAWRKSPTNKRAQLPDGCLPRRSRRLNG
jgi:uncharacterized protein YhdP